VIGGRISFVANALRSAGNHDIAEKSIWSRLKFNCSESKQWLPSSEDGPRLLTTAAIKSSFLRGIEITIPFIQRTFGGHLFF